MQKRCNKQLGDIEVAEKIAAKLQEKHGSHNHTHETLEKACPTVNEAQLQNTVKAQKRKIAKVQGELAKAELKVAKLRAQYLRRPRETGRRRQQNRAGSTLTLEKRATDCC